MRFLCFLRIKTTTLKTRENTGAWKCEEKTPLEWTSTHACFGIFKVLFQNAVFTIELIQKKSWPQQQIRYC